MRSVSSAVPSWPSQAEATPARSAAIASAKRAIDASLPYWGAEFALGARYFAPGSKLREPEREAKWVRFQMFKEWTGSGVYGGRGVNVPVMLGQALEMVTGANMFVEVERLRAASGLIQYAVDEMRHYILFARLHRDHIGPTELDIQQMGMMGSASALTELRFVHRDGGVGQLAVDMSEGGGLGLYFGIQHVFRDAEGLTAFDRELLDLVDRIVDDERGHMLVSFRSAIDAGLTDEQWAHVSDVLAQISRQKVVERVEQFGAVFPELEASDYRTDEDTQRLFRSTYLDFLDHGIEQLGPVERGHHHD